MHRRLQKKSCTLYSMHGSESVREVRDAILEARLGEH
jgi:hypothetical protein